jgi:hypothetical protein
MLVSSPPDWRGSSGRRRLVRRSVAALRLCPASRPNSTRTPTGGTGRSPPTSRPGQVQFLDARHRTQAHVEDKTKEVKACGAGRLPSNDYARNSAWLQIAALAVSLLAWLRHIGFEGDLAKAEPKMLRYRMFSAPARLVTHARKKILKIPPGWTRSTDRQRIHALHPA